MMRNWLVLIALLLASPALAQQQPPPYEPFNVGETDYKSLMTYLNTQPFGVVEPLANWLRQKEAEAVKAKAEPPKKEDDK